MQQIAVITESTVNAERTYWTTCMIARTLKARGFRDWQVLWKCELSDWKHLTTLPDDAWLRLSGISSAWVDKATKERRLGSEDTGWAKAKERKAFRLISDPSPVSNLQSFAHRRGVSLSAFYRRYFGLCFPQQVERFLSHYFSYCCIHAVSHPRHLFIPECQISLLKSSLQSIGIRFAYPLFEQ